MDHRALMIAATVGLSIAATHPAVAGAPGLEPDPVYRYKDLAPLGANSRTVETDADARHRSKRIVRTETRIKTTTRYAPVRSAAVTHVHYVPPRHYGPPRYRHGYHPGPRWRHGYPYKRVFRGPCIERVVRYTPRGKIIRIVNRCYRHY